MLDATPLLRLYGRRRLARLAALAPAPTQAELLAGLIATAARTRFGRAHGFDRLRGVEAYQRAVKLRDYDAFWAEWWRDPFPRLGDVSWPHEVRYFANSSGTTGGPTKRIPVSTAMIRANRRAALDVLVHHLANRPRSRVFAGAGLILGGSTALAQLAPCVRAGDLSGIMAMEVPLWVRPRALPPREIALLGDWGEKIARIARMSADARASGRPITSISGTPSWMLLFFDQVSALCGGARLATCYPELELVVHGGVGFAPYRERFAHWLAGSHAETREVYAASEGFFAVADRGDGEGMRLILNNGVFYEFVRPAELASATPDRRWIANAEPGVEYALVVTTNAGLWSYVVGDTVTLIDRDPPRVLVTGRTSWSLSIVGEHLIGAELDAGIAAAAHAIGATVVDYVAAGVLPDAADQRAGHCFFVELSAADGAPDEAAFARALDAQLSNLNEDYAAHRSGDVGMRPPRVRFVPSGGFAAWMRGRGKFGGQNKVPRVITDASLLAELRAAINDRHD